MIKVLFLVFLTLVLLVAGFSSKTLIHKKTVSSMPKNKPTKTGVSPTHLPTSNSPLAIENMREKSYSGSPIIIEQTLGSGSNYFRYLVSYRSDGLKIYGLLTVPTGTKPTGGWPVILFNHGYIPPAAYSTSSSYAIMVDPLASAGYIVFKPDYRGNGNSEGTPTQPYITPDYVTDSLNAFYSIRLYKDANPQKIGVFGHSMGGNISLHELTITHDIKAAELMAGVVGNENDLAQWWDHRYTVRSIVGNDLDTYYVFEQMIKDHDTPQSDPEFWNAIDPTQFLGFISAPIEIQVGSADEDVPTNFSTSLRDSLQQAGKSVDFHEYPGANHNMVPYTSQAMEETITFFNKFLK